MKQFLLLIFCVNLTIISYSQTLCINEFHYDNAGTDTSEFIEIAVDGTIDPALYSIHLVNGATGQFYNSETLDALVETQGTTFCSNRFFTWNLPTNGLQNDVEGIALCGPNGLIEFISYEGSFVGSEGCVDGITSIEVMLFDNGINLGPFPGDGNPLVLGQPEENGSTPVGSSLQRNLQAFAIDVISQIDGWVSSTESNPGDCNFAILALPITLTSFTAQKVEDQTLLKWETASELNNEFFTMEQSFDGRNWSDIGRIEGQGTKDTPTEYEFIDKNPINGTNFYRLKQTDFDGEFTYSDIVSVDFEGVETLSLVSCNKSAFNLNSATEGNASYTVYNSQGAIVAIGNFDSIKGNQSIYFQSELANGFYIVDVRIGAEQIIEKFIVQY